jgi:hypothetical protein
MDHAAQAPWWNAVAAVENARRLCDEQLARCARMETADPASVIVAARDALAGILVFLPKPVIREVSEDERQRVEEEGKRSQARIEHRFGMILAACALTPRSNRDLLAIMSDAGWHCRLGGLKMYLSALEHLGRIRWGERSKKGPRLWALA